ncbi:EVE domain-containing protein [Acetobacteraceae bacterium EV16G]|uniref:EVE domain-containing protein n=1 Tax=Sorlinia euscelidii TaxID=3081148 RepID=A0ABU7U4T2_9PROT
MKYWLIKSEPAAFSWDMQCHNNVEPWTGVRNFQARNNLAAMEKGDRAFFYHSVTEKAIRGIVEIVRTAYPDPTSDDPKWVCVDVRTVKPMARPVTLAQIKATPALSEMALLRQSRLSVASITAEEWGVICKMGGIT